MSKKKETQGERLATLETKVDLIITNHLKHLDKKVNWLLAFGVTSVVGLLLVIIESLI